MSTNLGEFYTAGNSSVSVPQFEVVHTQRMKPLAIHKGFHYRQYRINKEDVVIWVCIREKSSKCYGRMKTKGNEVIQITDHVCGMNEMDHARVKKSKIRDRRRYNAVGDSLRNQDVSSSVQMRRSVDADLDNDIRHSSLEPSALVEVSLSDNVSPQNCHNSFSMDNVGVSGEGGQSSDSNSYTITFGRVLRVPGGYKAVRLEYNAGVVFVTNMNIAGIISGQQPECEKTAVAYYQEKGILPARRVCPRGHDMKLYFGERIQWCCNLRSCRAKVNMRTGNWFQGSRLPFRTSLRFIYYWTQRVTTSDWCHRHLSMANSTTVEWNNYLREVCAYAVERQSTGKIGGENMVVEVDESVFIKRKNHDGHPFPQQCVFGGICRETNDCFLVQVPDRSLKTITAAITEHIAEGSIIYTDSWSASCISTLSCNLKANHHRYKFIDFEIVNHTPGITVRHWGSELWRNKRYRGTRHHLDYSYLAEFLWRRQLDNEAEDTFQVIMNCIKTFWPPDTELIWYHPRVKKPALYPPASSTNLVHLSSEYIRTRVRFSPSLKLLSIP